MMYEILPHTADVRVHAAASTLGGLFRDAMRGMFAVMRPRAAARKDAKQNAEEREIRRTIRARSSDREALLVDFLSEALRIGDEYREAYDDAAFALLTDTALDATVSGFRRESVGIQVKAVTYHGLKIEERNGAFEAVIVFDI